MGLFGLTKYNNLEKALLDTYSQTMSMTGVSPAEAEKMAEDMLDQVIEESKQQGFYYLPDNFGNIILGDAEDDNPIVNKIAEVLRKQLPNKKSDGVKDEDVKWWWNLNEVERRMMYKQDEIARTTLFVSEREKGKTANKAADVVKKFHPIFGEIGVPVQTKGNDRPLPYELKDRINKYIEKRAMEDPERIKKDIEKSTTFNALVRKEIKANNL